MDVLSLVENLKTEMRHSWLSNGRQESVAEHTWMMSVAAVLIAPHLQYPVDLGHTLKLIAIHDIAEAITGDIPYFEESPRKARKEADEAKAIHTIKDMLSEEAGETPSKAMARIPRLAKRRRQSSLEPSTNFEVQHQHNLADFQSWTEEEFGLVYTKMDRECAHDTALVSLLSVIRARAEKKMRQGGIDPILIKERQD